MRFEEYKNLWVFVETEENAAKPVGYELLRPGRQLADEMGALSVQRHTRQGRSVRRFSPFLPARRR